MGRQWGLSASCNEGRIIFTFINHDSLFTVFYGAISARHQSFSRAKQSTSKCANLSISTLTPVFSNLTVILQLSPEPSIAVTSPRPNRSCTICLPTSTACPPDVLADVTDGGFWKSPRVPSGIMRRRSCCAPGRVVRRLISPKSECFAPPLSLLNSLKSKRFIPPLPLLPNMLRSCFSFLNVRYWWSMSETKRLGFENSICPKR